MKSNNELERIIRSNLCNRCGTCVGLSQGRIAFVDREGDYRPRVIEDLAEIELQRILNACAGREFDFPLYRNHFYNDNLSFHPYIGPFKGIYIAYAMDGHVRQTGASGGMISVVLIFLLRSGRIDGAVVTGMSKEKPWLPETYVARTEEQILAAAQSKYVITSVNELLPQIASFPGRLAYVGLPGQVQSIRKLQMADDPIVSPIKFIIGPFYGNTLHFSSILSLLRSNRINNHRKICKLNFRHGEWPGATRIEMKDGRTVELPKFHANYLIPFHIMKNSLLCTDLSNEFTDISSGDAWAPEYEERGKGFSLVISRNDAADLLLQEMEKLGLIHLSSISLDEAITMHSHGYDLKKRGAFIRIKYRKFFHLPVPDYGYKLKGFPPSRYLMELVIDALFLLCGTRIARWLVDQFSPSFVGRIFEKSRGVWKRSTQKIKRKDLRPL